VDPVTEVDTARHGSADEGTSFVIAHRLSTISERIASSSSRTAAISEMGRHVTCCARAGITNNLYTQQFRQERERGLQRRAGDAELAAA